MASYSLTAYRQLTQFLADAVELANARETKPDGLSIDEVIKAHSRLRQESWQHEMN